MQIWWGNHKWFPLASDFQRYALAIRRHTPSSRNVRDAQRFRIARVTFPQRLHIGTPLRCQSKTKTVVS
jgi:hypothetical protein